RDAGRALVAVADRMGAGHDPRQQARDLIEHLRNTFLATMARNLVGLPDDDLARLEDQARRLGAPATVRAMEVLGEALVDMRESPDPRVTLEVALVRLCRPDADASPAALLERLERVERALGERTHAPAVAEARKAVSAQPPAPPRAPAPGKARPALGGVRKRPPEASASDGPTAPAAATATAGPAPVDGPLPTRDELTLAWGDRVLGQLSGRAKALYKSGRFVSVEDGAAVYALPNAVHRERCERCRAEVERALEAEFSTRVPIRLVVEPESAAPAPAEDADDDVGMDVEDIREAAPAAVSSPIDHVMQAFEGAEVVED
ncbi:MAG: dnaX, partial [Acidimicrobiales bacterium]|nr:dnaX [Acidimicrobiales bacterium]